MYMVKNLFVFVSVFFLAVSLYPACGYSGEGRAPAGAGRQAGGSGVVIAAVDVDVLLLKSRAGKALHEKIVARKTAFQKDFSSKKEEMRKEKAKISGERKKLSKEAFLKKTQEYDKKLAEFQRSFSKRRDEIDSSAIGATNRLIDEIISATAEVAENKGVDIVLKNDSVVVINKELDITADVMKLLDSKDISIGLE